MELVKYDVTYDKAFVDALLKKFINIYNIGDKSFKEVILTDMLQEMPINKDLFNKFIYYDVIRTIILIDPKYAYDVYKNNVDSNISMSLRDFALFILTCKDENKLNTFSNILVNSIKLKINNRNYYKLDSNKLFPNINKFHMNKPDKALMLNCLGDDYDLIIKILFDKLKRNNIPFNILLRSDNNLCLQDDITLFVNQDNYDKTINILKNNDIYDKLNKTNILYSHLGKISFEKLDNNERKSDIICNIIEKTINLELHDYQDRFNKFTYDENSISSKQDLIRYIMNNDIEFYNNIIDQIVNYINYKFNKNNNIVNKKITNENIKQVIENNINNSNLNDIDLYDTIYQVPQEYKNNNDEEQFKTNEIDLSKLDEFLSNNFDESSNNVNKDIYSFVDLNNMNKDLIFNYFKNHEQEINELSYPITTKDDEIKSKEEFIKDILIPRIIDTNGEISMDEIKNYYIKEDVKKKGLFRGIFK